MPVGEKMKMNKNKKIILGIMLCIVEPIITIKIIAALYVFYVITQEKEK